MRLFKELAEASCSFDEGLLLHPNGHINRCGIWLYLIHIAQLVNYLNFVGLGCCWYSFRLSSIAIGYKYGGLDPKTSFLNP